MSLEDVTLSEVSQSQEDKTLYDSTSKALSQNHSNRKQNGGCRGLEGGGDRMLSWRLLGIEPQFYKIKSSGDRCWDIRNTQFHDTTKKNGYGGAFHACVNYHIKKIRNKISILRAI